MLKGIPKILNPELLKTLAEMGHGDELLLADGNYPKFGQPPRVINCDGNGIPELLDAVLRFFPLDQYVSNPVIFMGVLPDDPYVPVIWDEYRRIISKYEERGVCDIAVQKPEFYDRASKAYATVVTGESALYANIILKKGVVEG